MTLAAVAATAEIIANICKSNWSPTDIVASKRKDGKGTNGIREPKKLTRVSPMYPTSEENGNKAVRSTIQAHILDYLLKAKLTRFTIHISFPL